MGIHNSEIIYKRLIAHNLHKAYHGTVSHFLETAGAIQAQDFAQARWAIATRFCTIKEVELMALFEKRELIRTWGPRGTLHIMRAEDVRWLIQMLGPLFISRQKGTYSKVGLSEATLEKSIKAIKTYSWKEPLSRENIYDIHRNVGISVEGFRGGFLMYHAGMKGLICPIGYEDQYYQLQEKWLVNTEHYLPFYNELELAKRYFKSHGPATLEDFCQWSGITKTQAKKAIHSLESSFIYRCKGKEYFALDDNNDEFKQMPNVHLLAGFDEYILGYKDRSLCIQSDYMQRVISVNGIFRPSILIHGEVAGIWRRKIKKNEIIIEMELFQQLNGKHKDELMDCVEKYRAFLNAENIKVEGI